MGQPSSKLKEIEQEWYEKLKKEGFEDIENTSLRDRPLKRFHSTRDQRPKAKQEAIAEYYRRASQLCFDLRFETPVHQAIWSLHANGISIREIEKALAYWRRRKISEFIIRTAKAIK